MPCRPRVPALSAAALALLLAAGPSPRAGEEAPSVDDAALGRRIDEAVQRYTQGGFWGVVLAARDGRVVLAKGYGYADYAARENAPDTLFEIASLSKQFTAAAVLRLEQQGRLSIGDPLAKHLPGVPADKRAIRLEHLLTHTAGISPEAGVPYASPVDRAGYVRTVLAEPLLGPPGGSFRYANAGYGLLAAVIDAVTGRPYEEVLAQEVFAPAGLSDTGFVGDPRLLASDRVSLRLSEGGPKEWSAANWHRGWGYKGMGGVVTTALDLWRWDRALRTDAVLGGEARRKLFTPAKEGHACGWVVEGTGRGTRLAHHGGDVLGYGCHWIRWLDEDATALVLSNGHVPTEAVAREIGRVLFPGPAVEAVVDAGARALDDRLAVHLARGLSWQVLPDGERTALRLRQGDETLVEVRFPRSHARSVLEALALATEAPRRASPGRADLEVGLYFAAYGEGTRRIELREEVEIAVLPRYEGQGEDGPVVDERVLLLVVDRRRGQWPAMVHMSTAAARDLAKALRKGS